MKTLYTLLLLLLISLSTWAQAPQKMSYQAVVRDSGDVLLTDTTVGMQISILEGSAGGTAVYVETHTPTTNANGLVTLEVGDGAVVSGDFTTIAWGSDDFFIKSEIDPTGGTSYTIEGTSQLLSVPYALFAGNVVDGNTLDQAYNQETTTSPTPRIILADDGEVEIIATGNAALELSTDASNEGLIVNGIGSSEAILVENGGTGEGIKINNTSSGDALVIDNTLGGDALSITNDDDGDALTVDNAGAGDALFIDNTDSTGSFAISVNNDGGSAAVDILNDGGGAGMLITNDGGGTGIVITQDGAGDGALFDNDGGGTAVEIDNVDNTAGGVALKIDNDAGGDAIDVTNDGGGDGLAIANTGGGDAVFIDNSVGAGGIGISLTNDGGGSGVDVLNAGGGNGFFLDNSGGGHGISIINAGAGNAVNVASSGTDKGINIVHDNPAATGEALKVEHFNDGTAVFIDNAGEGKGLSIFNGDPLGTGEALMVTQAGTATGLFVENAGPGKGAHILNADPTNADLTLFAATEGTGTVGMFVSEDNNLNFSPTVLATNSGAGGAGVFITDDEIAGKVNVDPTVIITSNGKGVGLDLSIANAAIGGDLNMEPALFSRHDGFGQVGHFETTNLGNFEHTVEIINKGQGNGLHIDCFDNPGTFADNALHVEQSNLSTLTTLGRAAHFDLLSAGTSADAAVLITSAATSAGSSALRVIPADPTKFAGVFEGKVDIATDLDVGGSFTAAAKAFKIDHPLDPDHKYLMHNSIESNERINIYSGNITTNDDGYAAVQLPEYMSALNKDFKYQLTIVDKSFAQAIIWEPIDAENNTFVIKTSSPQITVSWQITGTRQDTWALENPMQVEVDKKSGL